MTVPLAVLPEPGLILRPNGAVVVEEATDDRGRSLVAAAPAGVDHGQADRSRRRMYDRDWIGGTAVLAVLDPPATGIRRLRGKVPVIAVTRGPTRSSSR